MRKLLVILFLLGVGGVARGQEYKDKIVTILDEKIYCKITLITKKTFLYDIKKNDEVISTFIDFDAIKFYTLAEGSKPEYAIKNEMNQAEDSLITAEAKLLPIKYITSSGRTIYLQNKSEVTHRNIYKLLSTFPSTEKEMKKIKIARGIGLSAEIAGALSISYFVISRMSRNNAGLEYLIVGGTVGLAGITVRAASIKRIKSQIDIYNNIQKNTGMNSPYIDVGFYANSISVKLKF